MTALFDKIHKKMPHNRPGTSFRRVKLELPHDAAALNQIRYESKKPAKK